jgi:hypothetical protein
MLNKLLGAYGGIDGTDSAHPIVSLGQRKVRGHASG